MEPISDQNSKMPFLRNEFSKIFEDFVTKMLFVDLKFENYSHADGWFLRTPKAQNSILWMSNLGFRSFWVKSPEEGHNKTN